MNKEQLLDAIRYGEPVRSEDLSALDLDGADLSGAVFESVRFPRGMRGVLLKESTLVECDLSDSDASGADLHLATLYRSKIEGARFDDAKLVAVSFVECAADGASFARVQAPIASWMKTSLRGASFTGANLDRANLVEIDAADASFAGANLEKGTLYQADLRTADLSGADLTLTTLIEAKIGPRSFAGITLFRTQLMKSDLRGASFAGVTCPQCNFMGADLEGATFEGATAPQAFFGEAKLAGAMLARADLRQAVFEKADLRRANLIEATLEEACLTYSTAIDARFGGANLREADLSHADVTGADFSGARLYRTRFHATRREGAVLPTPAVWLGDDEERARIEGWKPQHGAEKRNRTMTAAQKLASTDTCLTTGTVERILSGTVEVRHGTGICQARQARSCLVTPEIGDLVLCTLGPEGAFVLAVLEDREGAPTTIAADGDLRVQSRNGRVAISSPEGVDLVSGGAVAMTSAELHVRARSGSIAVQELGFLGRLVQAEVDKVALVAREVDSVVTRLTQRAKRVFRFVEEIDQTRAGTVDMRAQNLVTIRGENAVIAARVLAKVDGEQIHLG